ncbi:hypothetical protein P4O66_011229, partial [Electrophorus voltai]
YEYTTQDGKQVSIKPNERYVLVAKTNDHWWHVRQEKEAEPFFIPAEYVMELPLDSDCMPFTPIGLLTPPSEWGEKNLPEPVPLDAQEALGMTHSILCSVKKDIEKDGHRMSTFVSPEGLYTCGLLEPELVKASAEPRDSCEDVAQVDAGGSPLPPPIEEDRPFTISPPDTFATGSPSTTEPASAHSVNSLTKSPSLDLNSDIQMLIRAGWDLKMWNLKEDSVTTPAMPASEQEQSHGAAPVVPATLSEKDWFPNRVPVFQRVRALCGPLPPGFPMISPLTTACVYKFSIISACGQGETELSGSPTLPPSPALAVWDIRDGTMVDYYSKERLNCRPKTAMAVSLDTQVEDDDLSAVYVNVPRIHRSVSTTPSGLSSSWGASDTPNPPCSPDVLCLGPVEWEAHTDRESGRPFYYHPATGRSTWDPPLSRPMEPESAVTEELPSSPSPACSPAGPSPLCLASGWEQLLDESTGRHYFFNPVSGESSWDPPEEQLGRCNSLRDGEPPPLPEEDYPAEEDFSASLGQEDPGSPSSFSLSSEYSLAHVKKAFIPRACLDRNTPPGWHLSVDADGAWVFTSEYTQEQWIKSLDERGQTYYYLRDGSKSQWNLPELTADMGQYHGADRRPLERDGLGALRTWRNSTGSQDEVSNLEKAGILNKTKISENGKKVRKNWGHSWTVLHGGILTFHKDPKSAPGGASSRTNQIVPEYTVDLRGATIGWAAKEKSSKKNVLELKSRAGAEFLIQYDTDTIINDWHKVIIDTIRLLDMEHHHSEDEEEISEKSSSIDKEDRSGVFIDKQRMSNAGRHFSSNSTTEADPKKVRSKLRKFLLKRPTLQSVKDKGYIRENVFGCHLQTLCAQEKRTVPTFVEKCIWTVERRGLGVDGIYRVSGNLAIIQKLRFKADHGTLVPTLNCLQISVYHVLYAEDLNLEEGHWDIHVITGALKLFFRELQEPLFPYSHFNSFVQGIKIPDYNSRVSYMSDLVKSLPVPNHDTMEALFSHLRKVIEHGEENRMTVQNVAIVFGPTLLKPEVESANLTMYMVFQNQIIEFILNEFETIFHM